MTDKTQRKRLSPAQRKARAAEALSLHLTGLSYGAISDRLGYGNMGNAYRAVQSYIEQLPDQGNTTRRRALSHHRLDGVWRLAWAEAEQGNVPAMRVLVEIERRRALLDGLDRPTVLQLEGPGDTQQQAGPQLREILPPEVVADVRSVRAQALALHRALPAGTTEEAG